MYEVTNSGTHQDEDQKYTVKTTKPHPDEIQITSIIPLNAISNQSQSAGVVSYRPTFDFLGKLTIPKFDSSSTYRKTHLFPRNHHHPPSTTIINSPEITRWIYNCVPAIHPVIEARDLANR